MVELSVVILSYNNAASIYKMNLECIESLIQSQTWENNSLEIILIESNANHSFQEQPYPAYVKVIQPNIKFNFHQFLNIGIQNAKGSFIALCNNDIIFYKNWFNAINQINISNKDILSFSPSAPDEIWNHKDNFAIGYQIRTHIKGWCIVAKKKLFDIIGKLDETFDFYYADDDYGMTLQKHRIKHALVRDSVVKHFGGANTSSSSTETGSKFNSHQQLPKHFKGKKLPSYLYSEGYRWILKNEKLIEDHLKFHKKWGSPQWISLKNKLRKLCGI